MKHHSSKILTAGIGYVLGGLLIKGIAFLTTPVFTRLLTTEEYGTFNCFLAFETIVVVLVGFQIFVSYKSANLRCWNEPNGIEQYHSTAVAITLLHTGLLLVASNLFFDAAAKLTGISSRLALNLLILSACGNALINLYNGYAALHYSYKRYLLIALANAVSNIALSLILIMSVFRSQRELGRICGFAISYILIGALLAAAAFKKASPQVKQAAFAYRYSVPLALNGIAEAVLGQYGKLTVDRHLGLSEMGVYSLSYSIYSIIGIIGVAIDYVVGPFYFEKRDKGEHQLIKETVNAYYRLLAAASVLVMLLTPEITAILGGADYQAARYTAIPLAAASYLVSVGYTVSQEILYCGKTHLISAVAIIAMAANVALNAVLVPKAGAMGAAAATYLSYLLLLVLYGVVICRMLRTSIFDWKTLAWYIAAISAMAVISLLVCDRIVLRLAFAALTIAVLCREGRNFLRTFTQPNT